MSLRHWYVSCPALTVRVATDDADTIREAAPIVRRFIGQPRRNLLHWLQRVHRGNVQVIDLATVPPNPNPPMFSGCIKR